MGRKKKATAPVNSSPASGQDTEPDNIVLELGKEVVQEKSNVTVTKPTSVVQETMVTEIENAKDDVGGNKSSADQWKIFTNQSRISSKGMGLKFLAPAIVDGCPTAKLEQQEVEKMNEVWNKSLILYIVGQNPTLTAVKSYLKAQWQLPDELTMFKHDEGYFVVKLQFFIQGLICSMGNQ